MSRRAKILLVLAFFVVLGIIFLAPHHGYHNQFDAYKKALVAQGEKISFEELIPPPPPGNVSNGGRAFLQVMAGFKWSTNLPEAMRKVAPGLADLTSTNLSTNEMAGYEQNVSNLALIRAALKAPVFGFNLDYSRGFEIPLPHLSKLRWGGELAAGTAVQAFHIGDFEEARADLLTAVDLARVCTNEPFTITGMVRAGMVRIAAGATWEGLHYDEWTDPQLAELQRHWEGTNLFTESASIMRYQRNFGIAEFEELRHASNIDSLVIAIANPTFGPPRTTPAGGGMLDHLANGAENFYYRLHFARWKSSWSYEEELCYHQLEDAAREASLQATDSGAFAPAFQTFNQKAAEIIKPHLLRTNDFLFNVTIDPNALVGKYIRALASAETIRRLTVTAIALKRYHLQHGAYPATLNDLVPDFLPAVPVDFMDGKPLRYKLRPDGDFLLYSVGEDGVDDGGDARPPAGSSSALPWSPGRDMVWPRLATPAAIEENNQKYPGSTNASWQQF